MEMQKKTRVLVVDDSAFMRSILSSALKGAMDIEVIGTAPDGAIALRKIQTLRPDVITLDVEMPGMTGFEVLTWVMKECPTPIVMVSTRTQEGAQATVDALRLGAVDYVAKPLGDPTANLGAFRAEVLDAVRTAAQSNRKNVQPAAAKAEPVSDGSNLPKDAIVAIGTSAGGPVTLHQLVPVLPESFPPVVITQHMPAGFTGHFAKRLNAESQLNVKEAEDQDELVSGLALIAPGDRHLRIVRKRGRLLAALDSGPKVSGYRPSVDALFESIADIAAARTVAVVLTGMGEDGAAGIRKLKAQGATTIAQDRDSCIVYGMPKAAADTGCVDQIVPLSKMALTIAGALRRLKVMQAAPA